LSFYGIFSGGDRPAQPMVKIKLKSLTWQKKPGWFVGVIQKLKRFCKCTHEALKAGEEKKLPF